MIGILMGALLSQSSLAAIPPTPRAQNLACVPARYRRQSIDAMPPAVKRAWISCLFAITAREMNARAPFRIDENTVLRSVSVNGAQLRYFYVFEDVASAADLAAGLRAELSADLPARVCADADMRFTIGQGGAYLYIWSDRAGRPIHRVLVDRCG
jgi:hypothetical protein